MLSNNIDQIREEILDDDGSCRDFNFISADRKAVSKLVDWFAENYQSVFIYDHEGIGIRINSIKYTLLNLHPTNAITLRGEKTDCFIEHIQIFIYIKEDHTSFVEITFFPKDIKIEGVETSLFLQLLKLWRDIAKADIGYLRYENSSWEFGDTNQHSGVIYVFKDSDPTKTCSK